MKESGGRSRAIGHDENVNGSCSRPHFLADVEKGLAKNPLNDNFSNNPPYYGLDMRYTHGIGMLQVTIGGTEGCQHYTNASHPECITINGNNYCIADLLNDNTTIMAGSDLLAEKRSNGRNCKPGESENDMSFWQGCFSRYNGSDAYGRDAIGIYKYCKDNGYDSMPTNGK